MSGTPCQKDPDAWFIGRDGKQYPDDELLSPAEAAAIVSTVMRLQGEDAQRFADRCASAVSSATRERRRRALTRRRHAKEACLERCPMLRECGTIALTTPEVWGTWGGMYEEERQGLRLRTEEE